MIPTEFEPAIPASERPQTQILEVTATGYVCISLAYYKEWRKRHLLVRVSTCSLHCQVTVASRYKIRILAC